MPARIALLHILHMAAERGGAAVADRFESFSLVRAEYVAPLREELFFVGAEDIGHFEPMFSHRLSVGAAEWPAPDRVSPAFPVGFWWNERRYRRGADSGPWF